MKIIVLNGSPKGDISVTMQYVNYLQKKFTQHELKIINISQRILQIEKDKNIFQNIIDEINSSDGVIWAFPLYVFTVHSNYQRFIEMIFERKVEYAFKGKYTALLSTSVHFYDHTAINYMNAICDDLSMNYVDYFSLHMQDLEKEEVRNNLLKFAENYFEAIKNSLTTFKNYNPIEYSPLTYVSEGKPDKVDLANKKIVVVADSLENTNLKNMINKFRSSFSQNIELISLEDVDIKGSCLGCIKCGFNYKCAYEGKDGFIDFYNDKLKTADIIIFAGAIGHRYLSSSWKRFLDRAFFNTHTPSLSGKQIGFIIAGPLRQIPNLKQVFEAYTQWQRSNLIGFVTDEYSTSTEIDAQLYALSTKLIKLSIMSYSKPDNFLGVAAMKIFRDEIWGHLRFPFIADYKAYKALNIFDFPQKNYKSRITNQILMFMSRFPAIRKEIYSNKIKTEMIGSLKKIVDKQ